jgi:hypothetical protein
MPKGKGYSSKAGGKTGERAPANRKTGKAGAAARGKTRVVGNTKTRYMKAGPKG